MYETAGYMKVECPNGKDCLYFLWECEKDNAYSNSVSDSAALHSRIVSAL
jgi:hypothetical protein